MPAFRYERRSQAPLAIHHFARRLLAHLAVVVAMGIFTLLLGMAGYVWFEHLSWLDGFLNAAMLLGGMGPIHTPETTGGKLFAGFYALNAAVVLLVAAAVVAAPIGHRVLHNLHWENKS